MSIKVGVIGCGKIAQVRHIPEYAANPHDQVNSCCMKYRVANIKTFSDHSELRILSKDAPMPGATAEETTLEDVFLSCFGERSGDEHDNSMV